MRAFLIVAALCVAGIAPSASAEEVESVTVTAGGRASTRPDVAEIRAVVTGSAAMATDALKKFRENRRRAVEAIGRLKLDKLAVEGEGLSMSSGNANAQRMVQMFGGNNAAAPGQVSASETLLLRLAAVDEMKEDERYNTVTKIIDAVKDAGLTVGGSASAMQSELVQYRATKLAGVRAEAARDAMQAARKKADSLAALSSAKIVRVISARELAAAAPANQGQGMENFMMTLIMAQMGGGGGSNPLDESVANEFKPIVIHVSVEVRFATQSNH